jgi:hypothetical protein
MSPCHSNDGRKLNSCCKLTSSQDPVGWFRTEKQADTTYPFSFFWANEKINKCLISFKERSLHKVSDLFAAFIGYLTNCIPTADFV